MHRRSIAHLLVGCAAIAAAACTAPVRATPQTVVLVSVDGFRADYFDKLDTPQLDALASQGVRSTGLIPVFPTETFPNHYSIVTGLYPEHHGIVGNVMDDPVIGERFTLGGPTHFDPAWWGGEPIWVTARRHGLRSASIWWPGSDVPIEGGQPDDWYPWNPEFRNVDRVTRTLEWLEGAADRRPSFITLYFQLLDQVGHGFGPASPEVADGVARIDRLIGQLVGGVADLGLSDEVTFVIVSDHGMSALSPDRLIFLDDYVDVSSLDILHTGPYLAARPRPGQTAEQIVSALSGAHPSLTAFSKDGAPDRLHYRAHERIPSILALADDGWVITTRAQADSVWTSGGFHGYDPTNPSMHGLLIVAGAPIRTGVVVEPLEAVHLYEMMCRLLGITPAPNDGDAAATAAFWR